MSSQNIPPGETDSPLPGSSDHNQAVSPEAIVREDLPTDVGSTIPPSTNDQTEPIMEIHHHGHVHEKKKWKEYLFQFLMLFLAVLCGFLAEYQLEHKIEKDREKQLIQSLLNDLKADTANITALNAFRLNIHYRTDSLSDLLSSNSKNQFAIYYHASSLSRRAFFYSADGTIQQLKNAGGLRLVSNAQVADSIKAYDVLYRSILQLQALEEEQVMRFRELAAKIFDAAIIVKFRRRELNSLDDSLKVPNPLLKQNDPILLNELNNTINYRIGNSFRILNDLDTLKDKAVHLMDMIRKEYHLQ